MVPDLFRNKPRSRPPEDGAYASEAKLQWWYFDAMLENGHRFLTFFLPRFQGSIEGNTPDQPMLDIVLRKPDGETIRERRFFKPSELIASRDRFEASFGEDCSLRFEQGSGAGSFGRYLLCGSTGRLGYELELTPDLPPWAAASPSGRFPYPMMMVLRRALITRDYFHYVPLVPRGKLRGKITMDEKVLEVRGRGYHEQGRLNFDLGGFVPVWYWLHIEHPPWTLLSGTASQPGWLPKLKDPAPGGIAYVQKGETCLMAAFDVTGIHVDWTRIKKRDPCAMGEGSMAWEADMRFRRPGLKVKVDLVSKDVLEYLPFEFHKRTPVRPYWGQTVADAEVDVLHRGRRTRFRTEAVLETMVTGGL